MSGRDEIVHGGAELERLLQTLPANVERTSCARRCGAGL